ncbi:efflux RND transporter periplasmic adaptor subunit [Aestuariivita sp.]|jgi:HlyD family secretion protein|uniref:efflux RND transporter periplasmic adaptor subunit n=1 Tax=Aestuariivita sp. TaxID=1872407 RepID=UPI002172C1F5|nr:efflux RND transporter periplasmic adaptor subunit [Aestuariivita sp.]MCE8006084.1 efflux RND transporter periplasmic adaptor subunit [Aestuariivita sp.]
MSAKAEDIEQKLGIGQQSGRIAIWVKYLAVAVVLGAIGGYVLFATAPSQKVQYITEPAVIADFDVVVTATGSIEPTNLVEISSELSGTLKTVYADFNDRVSKGTVLAELDTTKFEARVAVSKASLDSAIARVAMAQATVEDAREKHENAVRLEERGVTAHQTFVSLRAAYIRAQAELQSAIADRALAEANLDLNQADLDQACICSPIDGVVLDRAVDAGQIVAAALSAPVLFTVAEDLTKMELQVDIDEADIGRTKVGNKAQFTVDAYDERIFPAEISEIRFAPKTIDGVVTYKAILTIDNSDLSLRPGMTATADITVAEVKGALTVPNAALRYAPPVEQEKDDARSGLLGMLIPDDASQPQRINDKSVWVLQNGEPVETAIRAGANDGRITEIVGGDLAAGDSVIVDQRND